MGGGGGGDTLPGPSVPPSAAGDTAQRQGQSRLGRTRPRGPLFPQPWMRLMELKQLQQCGGQGGTAAGQREGPPPRLGRVQPELEREERDGPRPGAERGLRPPPTVNPPPPSRWVAVPRSPRSRGAQQWGRTPRALGQAAHAAPAVLPTNLPHAPPAWDMRPHLHWLPHRPPCRRKTPGSYPTQHARGRHDDPGHGGLV